MSYRRRRRPRDTKRKKGLSTGAKAAIVISILIVVIAIIVVLIWWFVLREETPADGGGGGNGGGGGTVTPECTDDTDCTDPNRPICRPNFDVCVQCVEDTDCGAGEVCNNLVCELPAGNCQIDDDCSGSTPVCDQGNNVCVECLVPNDCGQGETCIDNECETLATSGCSDDTDCNGVVAPDPRPNCNVLTGKCAQCFDDADCSGGDVCLFGGCVDPNTTTCSQLEAAYLNNPDVSVNPATNFGAVQNGQPQAEGCDPNNWTAIYNQYQQDCSDDVAAYASFLNTLQTIPEVQQNNPQTDFPNFRNKFPFTLGCAQQPYIDAYNARIAALTPNDVKIASVAFPGECICHPIDPNVGGTLPDNRWSKCSCNDARAVWRQVDTTGGKTTFRIPPGYPDEPGACATAGTTTGMYDPPECDGATPTDPNYTAGMTLVDVGGGEFLIKAWNNEDVRVNSFGDDVSTTNNCFNPDECRYTFPNA